MIQGDGMFVVRKNGEQLYTRAGSFTFDETGTLVNPTGGRVQGYALDASGDPTGGLVDISLDYSGLTPPVAAGRADDVVQHRWRRQAARRVLRRRPARARASSRIANFNNPMGLEKVGETSFRESANSGAAQLGVAGEGMNGDIQGGAVEMSNVDLAAEFTNLILAQRGFQASSRVITTSDQVLEDLVNIKR